MDPVELVDGGLLLRPWRPADAPAMHRACQDPEIQRWTTVPKPYLLEHGSMDLRLSATDPDVADVGFLMAPGMRDKGYATAALRAMCEWGFEAFDLARIEWRAQVGNLASRRVAEKAGFTVEGVQRAALAHRGERKDTWVGSLLRTDL